nr:immunoglobulin kappa light chain-like [Misgurnus anguillicaudatus]
MKRVSFIIWGSFILLNHLYLSKSEVVIQPDRVMTVSAGDSVTLRCKFSRDHSDPIVWYKQRPGKQPYIVAMVQKFVAQPVFYNEFISPRFTIETGKKVCHLNISNVASSDEAMYYCGWRKFEIIFAEGTFLTLKGSQNQQKFNVSVIQHPGSATVHPGESVSLLCSVLSELTTAEMRMFWIRSDSEKSAPQIIYTRNQSDQCEIKSATQNCTYNLSKDIFSQTDAGIYYCALITCGKIFFGNGTKINMEKPVDFIVIILGVLLGVCVVVITVQAASSHKQERYCNRENVQDFENEHPSSQGCEAVNLHYAAPHFKEGKNRKARHKDTQESVYSQLNDLSVIEYRIQ